MLGLIGWLIIGALAGGIAGSVMKGGGYGLVGDIIVGLIGAVIGGWLAGLILNIDINGGQNWWITLPVAVIGAIILIWIVRMVTGSRARI